MKRLGDAWMCPDITPGQVPGRADDPALYQIAHRRCKPHIRRNWKQLAGDAMGTIAYGRIGLMVWARECRLSLGKRPLDKRRRYVTEKRFCFTQAEHWLTFPAQNAQALLC